MASQHPPTPQSTPIERLLVAAGAFGCLPPVASKEDVEVSFDLLRSLMLDVMMDSLDAHPYKQSWSMVTTYGDTELHTLMDMSVGTNEYSDNVARIKHLVQSAIDLLP